jgi:hypothetical protein
MTSLSMDVRDLQFKERRCLVSNMLGWRGAGADWAGAELLDVWGAELRIRVVVETD